MMYQLYILCLMSAVVFAKSDESKYIDLLPEEEKQEFLNRIARRIIEEIQAKDSPEQSQAEVSDDQLNAHHAYVQDLIKEESVNRENERKNYNVKENMQLDKDKIETYNPEEKQNNFGADRNDKYIDLTLRNNKHKEKNKWISSNDSTFSVIPVKVVYDNDNFETTESVTNNPRTPNFHDNVYEQDKHINSENSTVSHSEIQSRASHNSSINLTEENEDQHEINTQDAHNNSQAYESQVNITSNNDIQIFTNKLQNISHNSQANSTQYTSTTDKSMVKSFEKENSKYDDSFENTDTSTRMSSSFNKDIEIKDSSPKATVVPLSNINMTLLPFTTERNTEYISEKNEYDNPLSSLSSKLYVTTVKSTKGNANIKIKTENFNLANNSVGKEGIKTTTIVKNNVTKTHLRKRLQILSEEYKVETEATLEKSVKRKQNKNKNTKEYFVYEVPQEEPVFVPTQDKNHNEQPFVVPIYNFSPKHAYYNGYNHFGINNDDEDNIIKESFPDHEGISNKELNLRSSFEIEFNPKYQNRKKDINYSYFLYPHSHWKHKSNHEIGYNPIFSNDHNNNFGKKIKRDNNFKPVSQHEAQTGQYDWSEPTNIPDIIKYIPLKHRSESHYDDIPIGRKKHKKPSNHKLSNSEKREQIGAIKTLTYQEQKFGYLRPSKPKSESKRIPEKNYGLKHNNKRKNNDSSKAHNIELDYYFGHYRSNNRREDNDYNDQYFDIEDNTPEYQKSPNLVNGKEKIKRYFVDRDDDCEHGCTRMHPKMPVENFNNYLETLIKVLEDMIYRDNKDLVNYDWLLSTVDLESALKKLIDLTGMIEKGYKIHSLDSKLLKYVVYLYNTSSYKLQNAIYSKPQLKALQDINNIVNRFLTLLRRRIALPRNKKRNRGHKLTNPVEFWYEFFVRAGDELRTGDAHVLRSFEIFLNDLKDNLFEFHDAIKHIAQVTTYGNQSWYRDLKNIYLKSASKKQLMKVLLHLAASRLFSSIENTSKNAEEDETYINNNGEVLNKIQEEFIFVLGILERINTIQ